MGSLAKDLKDSETRLSLAASAAGIVLWELDFRSNQIWIPEAGRWLFGVGPEQTVKVHRSRLMEKMGVASVAELVRLCDMAGFSTNNAG